MCPSRNFTRGKTRQRAHLILKPWKRGRLEDFSGGGGMTFFAELELGFLGTCPYTGLADVLQTCFNSYRAGRKREVVLRLLRGEAAELLSRELAVPIHKLEQWRGKAEAALEGALKERAGEPANVELAAAMQRIGELSMENELLRAKMERPGPLARRRSR